MNKNKELKNLYENVADLYIKTFEQKHERYFEHWVGDDIGGIACFGDVEFLNFDDIRFDIDNKIYPEEIFKWLYASIDEHWNNLLVQEGINSDGKKIHTADVNFRNYCIAKGLYKYPRTNYRPTMTEKEFIEIIEEEKEKMG